MNQYNDASAEQVNEAMERSWQAFKMYRNTSIRTRASFLRAIAAEIEALGDALVQVAMEETNLFHARLLNERNRTLFQLTSYADACERGEWLNVRIDRAVADRVPPKPDIRKTMTPLGPVVVFGASNFPFAYSTAGGDTACAFAAGCSVVVKAHPAHPKTGEMVAGAISKAAQQCNLPADVFQHVYGAAIAVGEALVMHPKTKAVGFTGSFGGGMALFNLANQRKEPIPVFAEMGSVNPIYLLPEKLEAEATGLAAMIAASVTLSVGQFCTNPGILVGIAGRGLESFKSALASEISKQMPQTMLHPGIAKAYASKKSAALSALDVETLAAAATEPGENKAAPTVASTTAANFLANPMLHQEIFGPYSLLVVCRDIHEMQLVAEAMEGQLTSTVIGFASELAANPDLIEAIQEKCGRFIMNGVPTGVEVCQAMHHGGPYPATTDSRYTAVGADGITRFARPLSYQNVDDELLPHELQEGNPLHIARTVDGKLEMSR